MKELKLHGLAAAWAEQQTLTDYAGLGFDERLGLLVDAEWLTRNNARLKRNVKEAHLKLDSACLEDPPGSRVRAGPGEGRRADERRAPRRNRAEERCASAGRGRDSGS